MRNMRGILGGLLAILAFLPVSSQESSDTTYSNLTLTGSHIMKEASGSEIKQEDNERVVYPSQRGVHLGIRYQPTFSRVDFETVDGETLEGDFTTGDGYAVSLGYFFTNYFALQPEVSYIELHQQIADQDVERRVRMRYVNIPLMAMFHTNYGRTVNLNAGFGPQLGINAGARVRTEGANNGVVRRTTLAVNPIDVAIAYNAGLDLGFGGNKNVHFNIGFRGTMGLMNLDNGERPANNDDVFFGEEMKLNTYAVYAGFTFKL